MRTAYSTASWFFGFLALHLLVLGALAAPEQLARADAGGGDSSTGQCPDANPPRLGCANPGQQCIFFGGPGTCQVPPSKVGCACYGA
jgi:hypothetical protein